MANETKAATAEDITNLSKDLANVTAKVQTFAEDVAKKIASGEELSKDLKASVDKALTEQAGLREQIANLSAQTTEIDQKIARREAPGQTPQHLKTPGQLFVENDKVKEFLAQGFRSRGRVRADMAAITTANMTGLVDPQRLPGILALPERRMTVRDLLTPGRTSSNAIQYWQETGFTNAAAVVSEGATKPESDINGELVTVNVATIAHIMIASKQIVEDAPALQSHIDGRLRYGLAYVEEDQLLNGDGTGSNLHGIIPQATAYSAGFNPGLLQRIDTVRLALLQAELALFPATGIVTDPTSWARIELTKDGEGRYIFAMPQSESTPRLWGRPVVSTPAMSTGDFLVGAFKLGAQIFDREDANVELSTEDNDNFRRNLVTLRGEERLALAVYRPEAFITGTFQTST